MPFIQILMEEPSDFPALKMNTTQFAAETAWIVFIKKKKTKKNPLYSSYLVPNAKDPERWLPSSPT